MGVPMDIDASKARAASQRGPACYRCGSLDHFAKQCPARFDIRYMSQEDAMDFYQQQALDKDTAQLSQSSEHVVGAEKKEDF
ncbi:hypothetical protein E1B28_003290 [Marasmius oreades]|uniref:CCHC-type domain-containing protein n=1 Tax=Marasmius oreades TaxID=181124 RepID=A0A9P7RLX5_9AGAR|nr:uncharacterized protein E1B28_003290 [Marasmius oreades]KAG7085747.1 hypothetical protein E1B28_003290 [Marasmius oreades]